MLSPQYVNQGSTPPGRDVPGLLARAVVRTASDLGVDAQHILQTAGVGSELMTDAACRISGESMDSIWAAALEATAEPALGLLVGQRIDPTELGPASTMIASTQSLAVAMEFAARYSSIFGRQTYQLHRGTDELRLTMDVSRQPLIAFYEPGAELSMAIWVRLARRLSGPDTSPVRIRFRHRRPEHASQLEEMFNCPIRFDSAEPEISFAVQDARRLSAYSDPALVSVMSAHADALLEQLQPSDSVAESVVIHLQAGANLRHISADSTAAALGMSTRTMFRRLKAEGDSYQAALDRVRQQLCLARLEQRGASPAELTAALGFAGTSSFYRAFRRWTGRSFAEFRDEQAAAAS